MDKVVVPFPFGFHPNKQIRPNLLLQLTAVKVAANLECSIFADNHLVFEACQEKIVPILHCPVIKGRYESTFVLAKETVTFCQQNDIHQAIVVAAPDHQKRCKRDLLWAAEDAGWELNVLVDEEPNGFSTKAFFSRESDQWFTRSRWRFLVRERVLDAIALSPALYKWLTDRKKPRPS